MSPSSNQSGSSSSPGGDDDNNTSDDRVMRWTKKQRRKRTGWGPYQSVLNERSVDFNLTLDIQNLKQEIQTMETLRDILASKTMNQRHDPEGSLVRIVQEHYRIFRTGFNLQQSGRKRLMNERDQREFLHSVFDEHVDVGGDENGIHVLEQQIMLYTVFIKAIAMTLTGFNVIVTDDAVIVETKGVLHFQILRNTIAGMFPHVLSNEWLVSKLVGREVAPESKLSFYFNKHDKVVKFVAELDYVKTFAEVLTDPNDVAILLGRARITENCLIVPSDDTDPSAFERSPGVSSAESSASVSASPARSLPSPSKSDANVIADGDGDVDDLGSSVTLTADDDSSAAFDFGEPEPEHPTSPVAAVHVPKPASSTPQLAPTTAAAALTITVPSSPDTTLLQTGRLQSPLPATRPVFSPNSALPQRQSPVGATVTLATTPNLRRGPMMPVDHFRHTVETYFRVFAHGSHPSTEATIAQFLTRNFARTVVFGESIGRQVIADRWRSLSWCFNLLSFRRLDSAADATAAVVYEPKANRYRITAHAEYTLQFTRRSLELVFPHVSPDHVLSSVLIGALVPVASTVRFWLERTTGLVVEVQEQMDFESALSMIVYSADDLAFVLEEAAPIFMSFSGNAPVTRSTANVPDDSTAGTTTSEADASVQ